MTGLQSHNKKLIASGLATGGSLLGYFWAKAQNPKNTIPATIIGGFVGTVIATTILK